MRVGEERRLREAEAHFSFSAGQTSPNTQALPSSQFQPTDPFSCEDFHGLPRGEFTFGKPWRSSPSSGPSIQRATLPIGQTKLLNTYYKRALEDFQQLNCRLIAKVFVKLVEPRKQVKFPYNGKRSLPGSSQVPGMDQAQAKSDPEKTKPGWWPEGVKHKEPDHLPKRGRSTPDVVERMPSLITLLQSESAFWCTCFAISETAVESLLQI